MWTVGKKYITKNALPREPKIVRKCLFITPDGYAVMGPPSSKTQFLSTSVILSPESQGYWEEYKEPLKAKSMFLPVILWKYSTEPSIYFDHPYSTREQVQEYYKKNLSKTYKLLDIIEVSWQEKI